MHLFINRGIEYKSKVAMMNLYKRLVQPRLDYYAQFRKPYFRRSKYLGKCAEEMYHFDSGREGLFQLIEELRTRDRNKGDWQKNLK